MKCTDDQVFRASFEFRYESPKADQCSANLGNAGLHGSGWNENGSDLLRILSAIGIAVFQVTTDGSVVNLNLAARNLVGRFFTIIGGKLRPLASHNAINFEQFIKSTQRHISPAEETLHIVLRSTAGELIVCSRLRDTEMQEGKTSHAAPHSHILVLAKEVAPGATDLHRILKQDLELSPAEARLVVELHRHCDLSQAAASLSLSKETVRSQIRSVFGKLGLRKQSEVIRLIEQIRSLSLQGDGST